MKTGRLVYSCSLPVIFLINCQHFVLDFGTSLLESELTYTCNTFYSFMESGNLISVEESQ
jgi:hypothetical protein